MIGLDDDDVVGAEVETMIDHVDVGVEEGVAETLNVRAAADEECETERWNDLAVVADDTAAAVDEKWIGLVAAVFAA